VLRLNVWRIVLHLRGRAAGDTVSCGGIWHFGDLTTGAQQLALVLVPCQLPIYDPQSTDRWQEPVHQAPYVTSPWWDLGAKL
jgi:hypothetical protein